MPLSLASSPAARAKAQRLSPPENQNIWQNERGIWQFHCSYRRTRAITEKAQLSLSTPSVEIARARRDALFAWLQARHALVQRTSRQRPIWNVAPEELPWLEETCRSKFPTLTALPVLAAGIEKSRANSPRRTNGEKGNLP